MKLESATLRDPGTPDQSENDEQLEFFSVSVNFRVNGKMDWCRVFASCCAMKANAVEVEKPESSRRSIR